GASCWGDMVMGKGGVTPGGGAGGARRFSKPGPSPPAPKSGGSKCCRCASAQMRCTTPGPISPQPCSALATACRNSSRRSTASGRAADITASSSESDKRIGGMGVPHGCAGENSAPCWSRVVLRCLLADDASRIDISIRAILTEPPASLPSRGFLSCRWQRGYGSERTKLSSLTGLPSAIVVVLNLIVALLS